MRKPNGYGAVIKLSGNRRKPYAVRITTGWSDEAKQRFKYIGYYTSRKDAEIALADYNKNPYVLTQTITIEQLYRAYSEQYYRTLSENTQRAYTRAYRSMRDIYTLPIEKLNLGALQRYFRASDKSKASLVTVKSLLSNMFEFAIKNEWIPPERKAMFSHIDLSDKKVKRPIPRKVFTPQEIERLWDNHAESILILIYTGMRIGELLSLSKENVHLSEQYLDIVQAKTKAGIRRVPIADKILPLMERWECGAFDDTRFRYHVWSPCMTALNMSHTPHDTRHTFISLMAEKEVDQRIIKAIVGHSGSGVTEQVYTHISVRKLLDAVNLI